MESIAETMASNWTGSQRTAEIVRQQILERFGPEAAEQYDPASGNTLTYREALKRGYRVRRGEKSLKSLTFIEAYESNGQKKKIPKTCHLFFLPLQCDRIN